MPTPEQLQAELKRAQQEREEALTALTGGDPSRVVQLVAWLSSDREVKALEKLILEQRTIPQLTRA